MIDLDQARKDLESKSPEVWARLYGSLLLEELAAHRAKTGQLAGKLLLQSRNVRAAIRTFTALKRYLDAFARVTGWSPDRPVALKATDRRWQVSQALAAKVTEAAREFFETCARPLVEPKAQEPEEPKTEPGSEDPGAGTVH